MEMMPGFSIDNVKTQVAKTLRQFVGNGLSMSWSDLAEAIGSDDAAENRKLERRLRSYVDDAAPLMPLDTFVRVFAALPPEAFARVARFMGFAAAPLDAIEHTTSVRLVLAKIARLLALGNEYLADGIIDHRELAKLADEAQSLLPGIQALADTGPR